MRTSLRHLVALAALIATVVGALTPAPSATAATGFSIDLYRRGDFVSEMNKVSCVPAAMQTMINIMSTGADTSVATQRRLYALARRLSPQPLPDVVRGDPGPRAEVAPGWLLAAMAVR